MAEMESMEEMVQKEKAEPEESLEHRAKMVLGDNQATRARMEEMAALVMMDYLDRVVHLDKMVFQESVGNLVVKDKMGSQVHVVTLDPQELQVTQDNKDLQDKMDYQEHRVNLEQLDLQD